MKNQLLIVLLAIISFGTKAQIRECGTMLNLEEMMLKDPTLNEKLEEKEKLTQEWLKTNEKSKTSKLTSFFKTNSSTDKTVPSNRGVNSLCGYDNTYYATIAAPTAVNQIVSPTQNCTYGGEYVTISNLIKGRVYRISTCGTSSFDTQIIIYPQGGGQSVGFNDDWCDSMSQILFNPLSSGNYDILIDQYDCQSNTTCASLEVELVYTPRPVVTIPVVVHVIHAPGEAVGTGSNISDLQIQSQIDVLNEDYRRLNTNINATPAAFRGLSDDALIEFCLASIDELGDPTSGIVRYTGTQTSYDMADVNAIVKPQTIWDRDRYLNIWTINFTGTLLGFAQFPSTGAANTDGVAIKYDAFGRVGNVSSSFADGKTTVHEVGHWLDLKHIWGDDQGTSDECAGSDLVNDTPNQTVSNSGCPTYPQVTCLNGANGGDMFWNNMDYSDDACLSMFTYGQTARMESALFGPRASLLTSNGCGLTTVIADLNTSYIITKIFPNPATSLVNVIIDLSNENLSNISFNLFDIVGKEEMKIDFIEKNQIQFSTEQLTRGIYLYKILKRNANVLSVGKLIIN